MPRHGVTLQYHRLRETPRPSTPSQGTILLPLCGTIAKARTGIIKNIPPPNPERSSILALQRRRLARKTKHRTLPRRNPQHWRLRSPDRLLRLSPQAIRVLLRLASNRANLLAWDCTKVNKRKTRGHPSLNSDSRPRSQALSGQERRIPSSALMFTYE